MARDIARWRRQPRVDERLGVVVRGDATEMRFVLRRGDLVVGERAFPTSEVPCAEADATLAAAIASAIDAAEREPPPAPDAPAPGTDAVDPAQPPEPAAPPARAAEPPKPPKPSAPAEGAAEPEVTPAQGLDEAGTLPDRREELDHRIALAVQGTVLFGVLPLPAPGIAPAFEVTLTRIFEVRASALITTTQTYDVLDTAAQSRGVVAVIDMGMAAGRVDGCAGIAIGRGTSRARGCAGMLFGSVRTSPVGGAATQSTATVWAAPAFRAEVEIPAVPAFGVGVAADFFVPVVRPELVVERGNTAADAISDPLPPVGGSLAIGPFLHF